MSTVFSHIIQKRFSHEYENVATDSLVYIINSSESAREGFLKLLRGISPELPNLHFRTQHSIDNIRPDMWGFDAESPRVFIENKFWAGLTENQPVIYLRHLSDYQQPSVLLFIVPEIRQETVWRELIKRLGDAEITISEHPSSMGILRTVRTQNGPFLAITSWKKLLDMIKSELSEDSDSMNDLLQLRALCGAANLDAFTHITSEELTDQRIPAFILQAEEVVEAAVELAVTEDSVNTKGLNKQNNKERIGQYIYFPTSKEKGFGAWIGVHFKLWKEFGSSPLWLVFATTDWGRALAK